MNKMDRVYRDRASLYQNDNGTAFFYTECITLPETISLEESLAQKGTYLFCPDFAREIESFYRDLEQFFMRCPCRILWIENPEQPYSWWKCFTISLQMRGSVFRFGSYHFTLEGKTEILCRENVLILAGAFSFSHFGKEGAQMVCKGVEPEIRLSMFGEESGSLQFSVRTDEAADAFIALNTGIKYAMPLKKEALRGRRRGFLSKAEVLILKNGYQLLLKGRLTPYALLDENRTYLMLPEGIYESSLTDRLGRMIKLEGKGKLVFEREASYAYFNQEQKRSCVKSTYYLGIAGLFVPDRRELLAGLSGTEFFKEVRRLEFVPHRNGFLEKETEEYELREAAAATTSWLAVKGKYICSSENTAFFKKASEFFRPLELQMAEFEEFSPASPVFFWQDAVFLEADEVQEIDERVYQRRLAQLLPVVKSKEYRSIQHEKKVITPQGLCACIDEEDGEWSWLGIAQSADGDKRNSPDIRLCHMKRELQLKFQDKEVLFSIQDREEFLALCEPSECFSLEIDGWTFLLHPKDWLEGTCMIFKYTNFTTVAETMGEMEPFQSAWEAAHDGSGNIRAGYEDFVANVTDPYFQGILFLNVKLDVKNLPQELAVIMKGVDKDKMSASYVAIERSRIEDKDGEIYIEPSDVSAMITYRGESIVNNSGSKISYDFQTREMVVGIENSVLKSFNSTSELLINRMFMTSVSVQEAADGNCLVIKGSLQKSGGVSLYQFTLADKVCYIPEGSAILSIWIEELKMHDSGSQSEFHLSGVMAFEKLEECDLFAYGSDGQGLCFSGLKLVKTEAGVMYDDYTQLLCLTERSQIRQKSLVEQYGAVLEKIIVTKQGLPEDIGYTSINAPVRQSKIQTPWVGLIWRIGLGSLGGLSGQQSVSMYFLTAWCKNEEGKGISYYIGLKLPSVLSDGFSLQGLLNVGFQSISLLKNNKEDFFFQFHNISIRALQFSFPPGSMDAFIFGQQGKVGWYAAYSDGRCE